MNMRLQQYRGTEEKHCVHRSVRLLDSYLCCLGCWCIHGQSKYPFSSSFHFFRLEYRSFLSLQVNVTKAGGALGIITAFVAYYCAVSELLVKEDSYFSLPLGDIPKKKY